MAESNRNGGGRPTKFRPEFIEEMRWLAAAGVNDAEIAARLGVHRSTMYHWLDRCPEFAAAHARKPPIERPMPRKPRRYRSEFAQRARTLCESGHTLVEVAGMLGFHRSTFDRWRREYPELAEAVRVGRAARRVGAANRD